MSSSYDFQAHLQRSQRWCFSQTALLWFEVLPELLPALRGLSSAHWNLSPALPDWLPALPGAPKVLSGALRCSQTYHNHSHCTPVAVICDPSYSEGRQECPPRVWYSAEIDASKITLHILSDTPGVFQWLKYILLMYTSCREEENSMQGTLILSCEGCTSEAVQIWCWNNSNDRYTSHFSTYPWCFPEHVIDQEVGWGNGYLCWGWDFLFCPIRRGVSEICGESILCQTWTIVHQ